MTGKNWTSITGPLRIYNVCCVSTDRASKSDEGETPQELKGEKFYLLPFLPTVDKIF